MAEKEPALKLSLSGWQKRMLHDHMGTEVVPLKVSKLYISVIDKRQWIMYRQPQPTDLAKGAWNLYLTDAQIKQVVAVLGAEVQVAALRISPDAVKSGQVVLK